MGFCDKIKMFFFFRKYEIEAPCKDISLVFLICLLVVKPMLQPLIKIVCIILWFKKKYKEKFRWTLTRALNILPARVFVWNSVAESWFLKDLFKLLSIADLIKRICSTCAVCRIICKANTDFINVYLWPPISSNTLLVRFEIDRVLFACYFCFFKFFSLRSYRAYWLTL